jgi:hypothetical protein
MLLPFLLNPSAPRDELLHQNPPDVDKQESFSNENFKFKGAQVFLFFYLLESDSFYFITQSLYG